MSTIVTELRGLNDSMEVIGETSKALATVTSIIGDGKKKSSILSPIISQAKKIGESLLNLVGISEDLDENQKKFRQRASGILAMVILAGLAMWLFRKKLFSLFSKNTPSLFIDLEWYSSEYSSPKEDYRYYFLYQGQVVYGYFSEGKWYLWNREKEKMETCRIKINHFYPAAEVIDFIPYPRKSQGYEMKGGE